jgi:hypothetical protein
VVTSPYIVYALIDPRTYDVRYIGKSSSMFKRARAKHSAHCWSWIKSLEKEGLVPVIKVLSFEDDHEECLKDEIHWIAFFRKIGADLTNIMDGGEGVTPGTKQSPEAIEKRVAKLRGRKRDPAIGKKISAALSGRRRITKTCPKCGEEFSVMCSRSWRVFCSHECDYARKRGTPKSQWKEKALLTKREESE